MDRRLDDLLGSLGLSEYLTRFRDHAVDFTILPDLTDSDLKEIGLPLGHRRKLLRAIGEAGRQTDTPPPHTDESRDDAVRRQLTVLFCDMVGSAALSTQLDPEDLRLVISRHHSEITRVIRECDGFVARYMGDGILAYFGYPEAHEDDAAQAASAALGSIEAITRLRAYSGAALELRAGIATGLVVVGDLLIQGSRQEQGVVGETPNLAARLQALARPNTVVICSNTRRLIEGRFEFRDLGKLDVRGWSQAVQAWQLMSTIDTESRYVTHHREHMAPLYGRDEEVEMLMRRWADAVDGEGRVVLLTGEAGIGKSHIASAIQQNLEGKPHAAIRYLCSAHHTNSVLFPFIAQLERAAEFGRSDNAQSRLKKLSTYLAQIGADGVVSVAILAHLLSIPCDIDPAFRDASPARQKEQVLSALLRLIEQQARQKCVFILVEDIHWIDPTSLELLTLLVEQVPAMKALLLATARSEFVPPWPRHAHITTTSLTRLGKRSGVALINRVTAGKRLPDDLVEEIIVRTDGVPLFIEELTKTIIESGVLQEREGRYECDQALPAMAIPTTLQASLTARLDRLAPVREVAQIGAVVGRQFSYEVLASIAGITPKALDDALQHLVASELVFCRGQPPNSVYTFKHALVRDAAYESLLKTKRLQFHAAIADTFERHFPEIAEAQPETIAHHLTEAGLLHKARQYWLAAGKKAAMRSANQEAIAHLRRGLSTFNPGHKDPTSAREELDFRLALGPCLIATHGPASALSVETFVRSRALCERLEDPPEYLEVMFWLTTASVMRGELPLASETITILIDRAQRQGDRPALLNAMRGKAMILMFMGRLGEASTAIEEALSFFEASDEADRLAARSAGQDAGVADLALMSWCLWLQGSAEAVGRVEDAIRRADAIAHPHSLAYASYYASVLYAFLGNPETSLLHAKRCLELSEEHGFRQWRGLTQAVCANAQARISRNSSALDEAFSALEEYRKAGYQLGITALYALLADTYLKLGRPESAQELLDLGMQTVRDNSERIFEAEFLRLSSDASLCTGVCEARKDPHSLLQQAAAVATYQGAEALLARISDSLADLGAPVIRPHESETCRARH